MLTQLINLDSRPDRLGRFAARAAEVGLAFERLPACDGALPEYAEMAGAIAPTPTGEAIGPRAMACLESHRAAWRAIVGGHERGRHAMGAVFEDDVHIADDLGRLLGDPSWVPEDADLVRLETMNVRAALGPQVARTATGRGVHRLRSLHMGAAGYLVTRAGAGKLLAGTRPVFDTMDRMIFDFRTPFSRGLRIYQMMPAACVQADLARGPAPPWSLSDINAERYRSVRRLDAHGRPVRGPAMKAAYAARRARKASRGLWAALRHGGRYRHIPYAETPPETHPETQGTDARG